MPLDFPNSPTNGQIFTSGIKKWQWSTAEGSWLASNYAPSPENVNGIVKCNGSGNFSAAVAGTDYLTSATLSASPATAKAWACFTMRYGGDSGEVFVYDDYGISAINFIATGRVEVVFSSPMPNRRYSVICQYAENVTNGFTGGGSVAIEDGDGNSDFPSTQPSPNFTDDTTSGKTTAKVKIGFGATTTSRNPTECYVHIFSS